MRKNFCCIILLLITFCVQAQKNELLKTLAKHQQNENQRDDITLIGLKS